MRVYRGQLDLIEILMVHGGGFVPLTCDTTTSKRTHKPIHRKGDHAVGPRSNEVSVTAGG